MLQTRQPLGLEAEPHQGPTHNWIYNLGPIQTKQNNKYLNLEELFTVCLVSFMGEFLFKFGLEHHLNRI